MQTAAVFVYNGCMRQLCLIVHNVRSSLNVGSLLRTADGLAVAPVYLTGYTPYPAAANDDRLPHLARKTHAQIAKTALGAETSVKWQHFEDITAVVARLKAEGYRIVALEQAAGSRPLTAFQPPERLALIVGREVEGIEPEVLELCDEVVEIPMLGRKESFNVAQAAAMALYHCRFA